MSFTGNEGINIWEMWLSDNAHLSGVNLLQLWRFYEGLEKNYIDILDILGSLPALEPLVMYIKPLGVQYIDSLKAFVPMGAEETSGRNQSSWEGQISGVLLHNVGGLADCRCSPHSETGSDAHSQRHCHFVCYYRLSFEESHLL